jgi:outer membrane receptor for ferrienterochelin and colicins
MTKFILPFVAMLTASIVQAQNTFQAVIKDVESKELLIGSTALLKGTTTGSTADVNGKIIINNIPDGKQAIEFSFIGYETKTDTFNFPLQQTEPLIILMTSHGEELEEVVISSTRTSRTIENVPTRVETIELEEIDEKSNMRPSNVSMILHESTGIQVQQTSATSANASIRIQGLDGRYTQLLKDAYPNFGNFASGLSILEIPPLDLKQVEIIKGPASTLYGAGAIAGVVNFISKTPEKKGEYNFIVNQSHVGQTNVGGFASKRKNKIGYTFLALGNLQQAYDVDKDDFTELPKAQDFTVNPKLFFYPKEKISLMVGNSFTKSDRIGGDIQVIKDKTDTTHTYFEENNTLRNTSTIEFDKRFKEKNHLTIRSSFSYFDREIKIPSYQFKGTNYNSFSDIAYVHCLTKHTLIIGANIIYDRFFEKQIFPTRDFTTNTTGIYFQDTWDISSKLSLEGGLREDVVNYSNSNYSKKENFLLPRISALFKISDKWTSRIGGGLGYKTPTMFTEQTEGFQYRNMLALNNVTSEKSSGATADISYKTAIGSDFYFAINQMFFYTHINNATVLQSDTSAHYFFSNTNKSVQSLGFETNAKLIYKENFKFFVGFTYTDATASYLTGNQFLPLLPKNKLNLALVYEKEKDLKIGLEAYFTDQQYLNNGSTTPSFWELGFMTEKTFNKIAVYINAENFTNVRQSTYKRVVNEPHNNPTFDDIWTHTEGFVFSAGIKLKL